MKRSVYIAFAACLIGLIPLRCQAEEQDKAKHSVASYAQDGEEMERVVVEEKDYNKAVQIAARKGDEVRKIGAIYYIVPKGAKIYKQRGTHGVYNVEDPGTYLGRVSEEIDIRIKAVEDRQEKMEKELEALKNSKK